MLGAWFRPGSPAAAGSVTGKSDEGRERAPDPPAGASGGTRGRCRGGQREYAAHWGEAERGATGVARAEMALAKVLEGVGLDDDHRGC